MDVRLIFPPERVTIVAVLNITPDSFSDGGRFLRDGAQVDPARVVVAAASLLADGAHVLDVGGESTRPGAAAVAVSEEIDRTAPVIEALAKRFDAPLSIDTRKGPVAEAALAAGARIVNDISGLRFDPQLAKVAARAGAALIIGHSRGTPETMQDDPHYTDVVGEVAEELRCGISTAQEAGLDETALVVDPGIGFGKRLEDNLALIANAGWLRSELGLPLLLGPSRKSFLGTLTGDPVAQRDRASAAACAVAAFAGADALRVHDVAGAVRAVRVGVALAGARQEGRA